MAILRTSIMSACLQRSVDIIVVLPSDSTNFIGTGTKIAKPPYKTLYLLHGIYGSEVDWISESSIHRLAKERQMAVVMPAGENHFYIDNGLPGGAYGEFIGKELVDITRRMFRLSDKREDTYIAGLSMGGYGAFVNALRYPEVFSYAGCISTACVTEKLVSEDNTMGFAPLNNRAAYEAVFGKELIGENPNNLKNVAKKAMEDNVCLPKLMLTQGAGDFMIEAQKDLHEYLTDLGLPHEWEVCEGYMHTFDFFKVKIKDVLDWMPHGEILQGVDSGNVG